MKQQICRFIQEQFPVTIFTFNNEFYRLFPYFLSYFVDAFLKKRTRIGFLAWVILPVLNNFRKVLNKFSTRGIIFAETGILTRVTYRPCRLCLDKNRILITICNDFLYMKIVAGCFAFRPEFIS